MTKTYKKHTHSDYTVYMDSNKLALHLAALCNDNEALGGVLILVKENPSEKDYTIAVVDTGLQTPECINALEFAIAQKIISSREPELHTDDAKWLEQSGLMTQPIPDYDPVLIGNLVEGVIIELLRAVDLSKAENAFETMLANLTGLVGYIAGENSLAHQSAVKHSQGALKRIISNLKSSQIVSLPGKEMMGVIIKPFFDKFLEQLNNPGEQKSQ